MKLRFTRTAAHQLGQVVAHIAQHDPSGAGNVQERVRTLTLLLQQYPLARQATERAGIRRIVVSPYPYILTYRVGDDGNRHPHRAPWRTAADPLIQRAQPCSLSRMG